MMKYKFLNISFSNIKNVQADLVNKIRIFHFVHESNDDFHSHIDLHPLENYE